MVPELRRFFRIRSEAAVGDACQYSVTIESLYSIYTLGETNRTKISGENCEVDASQISLGEVGDGQI